MHCLVNVVVWIIIQEILTLLLPCVWKILPLPISVGLGCMMCFEQWDVRGCDTGKSLECSCVVGFAILHLCQHHEKRFS